MARPTKGQRRLMYGLFGVAVLVTLLGIAAVWALTYGPLG
jgi:Tfp pilus assembly protein PilN